MLRRLRARADWWRGARAYDREHGQRYLLVFTLTRDGRDRCVHRTRRLGLRCMRLTTHDGWCGFHNSVCWRHEPDDGNRCDGRYANV